MDSPHPPAPILPIAVENNGYQTPMEEAQGYFPQPSTSSAPARFRPQISRLTSFLRRQEADATGNDLQAQPDTHPSLDELLHVSSRRPKSGIVSIRDRIACYQWTFFTMATGGMGSVLSSIPYRAAWVDGLGLAFVMLNLVLFILNCILITMRFCMKPGSFTGSFTDQVESLFIPAFKSFTPVNSQSPNNISNSIAIIIINICQYGIPKTGVWLLRVVEVLFWIYLSVSILASAVMYLTLWSTLVFPIHMMTPTWVFPAYPMLLNGTMAASIIGAASSTGNKLFSDALAVALGGFTTQGTACLIAFMISAAFIYRLMTQKLPRDFQRPGVFISIGPFAFTVNGIVQLAIHADFFIPQNFLGAEHAVSIIRILAVLSGLWLWGLSFWFFLVSVGSLWKYVRPGSKMPFRMTWWSFVFPNSALITATQSLGTALSNEGLKIFGCVMAGVLLVVWLFVFVTMLRCLKNRELLWPKDDL
ncbi:hypothetical protein jhhlp_004345 [Lomentospora prolificans]|uniref:C4-dicarboxylate transporter/malic acid transport protein n=1 Tax=Lomentospora prolificans TaxID=41688 RepID=A0A2N3NBB4_9PEZI|nr:hypothetical protein jhhlp_004345 [Lomentospora prolificans]